MSTSVLEPIDAKQTAAMLADAARQELTLVPRGSATKLALVPDAGAASYLSTRKLSSPVQHFAGDLVATMPSGATLASANAILAESGQWLPLDPSFADSATIGGVVATNDSGPRRHKHGSPRDLIIGVEIALCDGRLAKAGGRVVKNVAGYDLSRLVCGSFGSLAVITSATFKLAPLPQASRTLVATCADSQQAARLALAVAALPVTPSAVELQAPSARLLVRFESTERAADQMAATARSVINESGTSTEVIAGSAEHDLWHTHDSLVWNSPGLVAKVCVLPTDVEGVIGCLASLDSRLQWSAIGRAALGVLLVRLHTGTADESALLATLHQHIRERRGTMSILRGSTTLRLVADHEADAALKGVMSAIKSRFDPTGVLPALP
jgi:glycolate dehydrogenase FAD-binding subunit